MDRRHQMARVARISVSAVLIIGTGACDGSRDDGLVLTADMPLHLEDHLDAAVVDGSELPATMPATIEWRFDEPQPEWEPAPLWAPPYGPPVLTRTADALRITLTDRSRVSPPQGPAGTLRGAIYVDVADWNRGDWTDVVIRARTDAVSFMLLGLNLGEGREPASDPGVPTPIEYFGRLSPLVRDGTIHTYRLRVGEGASDFQGPWRQLVLFFGMDEPGSIDVFSVRVVPAAYAEAEHGTERVDREGVLRPALYTHVPSRVRWRVRVPEGGRLGIALTTQDARAPVTFSVNLSSASSDASVFEELVTDETSWHVRSVDLSAFAGRTVDLSLRTESERPGTIGFWGTPILSGTPVASEEGSGPPSVILYVIDGAGADLMSLYGYNRNTTPRLERLAADGVVFDRAYSNSAWTKPSTASFLTSLQHSALGGFRDWGDRIPEGAPTMAQRFHAAGYQTAVFTFHPNAGKSSALDRGVDRFQDQGREGQTHSESSRFLQDEFWSWREAFPGSPYWAHFQVTDVHEPSLPVAPFAGMFVDGDRRERFMGWKRRIRIPDLEAGNGRQSVVAQYREALAKLGVDRTEFFDVQRGLYDETMAHADHQLGRFVDRLKATGEWAHTVLIVTADHGHPAGSYTRFGRELFDPPPSDTEGAFFDSYRTRVPLVMLAPGRLPEGLRVAEPVSLVDLLPTVLDLAGLPPLERTQGRSLLPLIRGDADWDTRPVILEQLERDVRTDEFTGHIEMIDGRWGASLEIWPERGPGEPPVEPSRWAAKARFHVDGLPRLLLYDLWEDPFTLQNVNNRYPELVEKYTQLLEAQWQSHLTMAALYEPGGQSELGPEQLQALRALGYIR